MGLSLKWYPESSIPVKIVKPDSDSARRLDYKAGTVRKPGYVPFDLFYIVQRITLYALKARIMLLLFLATSSAHAVRLSHKAIRGLRHEILVDRRAVAVVLDRVLPGICKSIFQKQPCISPFDHSP